MANFSKLFSNTLGEGEVCVRVSHDVFQSIYPQRRQFESLLMELTIEAWDAPVVEAWDAPVVESFFTFFYFGR